MAPEIKMTLEISIETQGSWVYRREVHKANYHEELPRGISDLSGSNS